MGEKKALCGVAGREVGYREQHNVRVPGIVVHRRVKLPPLTTGKRVSERGVATHPLAQFDDARFLGSKIYEVVTGQNRQYIEVVGEPPIHTVGADIGGKVRRVNKEHNPRSVFESLEQISVVAGFNLKSGEVIRAGSIVALSDIVVERLGAHLIDAQFILHGEHERGRERDEVEVAGLALLLFEQLEYMLTSFAGDRLVPLETVGDRPYQREQPVGALDIVDTVPVVVEIVIYYPRPRVDVLGDVRQQAGAAEQVNKCSIGRVLFYYLDKVFSEHSLLPHEWKWSREV